MIVARQFIAWYRCENRNRPVERRNGEWAKRRWGELARSAFVPEGLNDRSQAIYCLVFARKREPSRKGTV